MSESPHPPFGVPWAAKGEERPAQFCTPLAHAPGHNGGVMFMRFGQSCDADRWLTMTAWKRWVADVKAAPVKPEQPEALWSDEGECQSQ